MKSIKSINQAFKYSSLQIGYHYYNYELQLNYTLVTMKSREILSDIKILCY